MAIKRIIIMDGGVLRLTLDGDEVDSSFLATSDEDNIVTVITVIAGVFAPVNSPTDGADADMFVASPESPVLPMIMEGGVMRPIEDGEFVYPDGGFEDAGRQAYMFVVSTQGIEEWEGPQPSPTDCVQAIDGTTPNTWPDDPAADDDTDYPPDTCQIDLFAQINITGTAIIGLNAASSESPAIPVVSYYSSGFASSIAYHDGSAWQTVTHASLSWDGNPMVHQAGDRVFATNVGGSWVQAREVTSAGVGALMENAFGGSAFITCAVDGVTPIALESNDGLYRKFFELIGDTWTHDEDSIDSYTSPNPLAGGWGAFYYVNSSLTKAVWNGSSWTDDLCAGSSTSPGNALGTVAVLNSGDGSPNEPMAVWTNHVNGFSPTRKVYFEDVVGGSPAPYEAITYSSPYYPTYLSADSTGKFFSVVLRADADASPPLVLVYKFNGRNVSPTLIGTRSYPGHYRPAGHDVSVDVATTTNITLYDEQVVDGYFAGAGTRVMVHQQTDPSENGIWVVVASGAWVRASDADTWAELLSAFVLIYNGDTLGFNTFNCTIGSTGTLDTDPVTFEIAYKPLDAETGDLGLVGLFLTPSTTAKPIQNLIV